MFRKISFYIIGLFFIANSHSFSQDCTDYHIIAGCFGFGPPYSYNTQSTSISATPLDTIELNFIAYKGIEYIVNVCNHKKLGRPHFKVYEQLETKILLYDNEESDFLETIIFNNDHTRNIILEVTFFDYKEKYITQENCVGILIEFKSNTRKRGRMR